MTSSAIAAYIGLGSNLGQREAYLSQSVRLLCRIPGVEVVRCSNIYETEPVGFTEQPAFLNMVAAVQTTCSPQCLLAQMLEIEKRLGRTRDVRWGPRTIDLDLLLYGDVRLQTEELTIPHPRMFERLFVLIPLLDVLPRTATWYESVDVCRQKLAGKESVKLWKKTNWRREFELSGN
jgi:2-amino-4-hydroxy-6-hydroxymethyldihydropteridine diphosphokinase